MQTREKKKKRVQDEKGSMVHNIFKIEKKRKDRRKTMKQRNCRSKQRKDEDCHHCDPRSCFIIHSSLLPRQIGTFMTTISILNNLTQQDNHFIAGFFFVSLTMFLSSKCCLKSLPQHLAIRHTVFVFV